MCTHYLPALAVSRVRERIAARVIMTVTDHTAHRAWIVPGVDAYCVADAAVARSIQRHTRAEVTITGIPIAGCTAPVRAVKAELATARVLALLGGLPSREAHAAIEALAPLARHELHVLCGDDPAVIAHARRVLPRAEVAARADGLYGAIERADVVITKAGGLTIQRVPRPRPRDGLAVRAPGQERGNLQFYTRSMPAQRCGRTELADLAYTDRAVDRRARRAAKDGRARAIRRAARMRRPTSSPARSARGR